MEKVRGTGKVIAYEKSLPLIAVLPRFLFPVLLLAMLVMAGCVTTEEAANTKSSLAQLQIQVSNNNRDISQLKEQTGNIVAIKESQSTILSQTSDYSKELQSLRGRFDENKYFQDKTLKDLMSELELQKARVASLESQLKEMKVKPADVKDTGKSSGDTSDKPAADNNAPAPKGPEMAAKLYDEAHIALKEKRIGEARRMFERFIKEYPKESLASNSYFWIGESYYSEKKYEDAILAYEDFLKKYPNHDKARGAMLKQGYAFIELGGNKNKLAGKDILENLIEKYPKSKEAAFAQKKIKEISTSKSAPASKSKKRN
jgi:tol-pal system protein YbgF